VKRIALILSLLTLAACENPDFTLGARITGDGISPSLGVSDGNVSVVVSP
jgi:hypothetical protein